MGYNYETEKTAIFTNLGQRQFLSIRDYVHKTLKASGVITMGCAIDHQTGSSWEMMACVDRLVELHELIEVNYGECAGQDRIFRAGGRQP